MRLAVAAVASALAAGSWACDARKADPIDPDGGHDASADAGVPPDASDAAIPPDDGEADAASDGGFAGDASDAAPLAACNTDGGVVPLVTDEFWVYQVAVDGTYVYLAAFDGIYRVPRSGGPREYLTSAKASGGGRDQWVLAVDSTTVYFQGSAGTFSAPIDGGHATPFSAPYTTGAYALEDGVLYGAGPDVWSMPLDGGPATTRIAAGPDFIPGSFAPFGGQIYATSAPPGPAQVVMAAADAGAPAILVPNRTHPGPIAVDATGIYWGEWSGGVFRADLDGGHVVTLSTDTPTALAIDQDYVYWTSGYSSGFIGAVPKSGGPEITLATGLAAPAQLVGAGGDLYWCSQVEADAGAGDASPDAAFYDPTVLTTCK